VPSTSLRKFIEDIKENPDAFSKTLQDTLISAGLLNPSTGKIRNPWDESKSFPRRQRVVQGKSFSLDVSGSSMVLSQPSTHKLLVRYCKDCTGTITDDPPG